MELKLCPFCGASGKDLDAEMARSKDDEVAAGCYVCGACGPMASNAEESTRRWNERVDEVLKQAEGVTK